MAWLETTFFSNCLHRNVPLNIVAPLDPGGPVPQGETAGALKTLYLLNGYFGNCTDWLLNAGITELSQTYHLCVVMPSGDNSFYVDYPGTGGDNYGEYIGRELVDFTRKLLPLSDRREDTILGGLSMGGFGALRNGVKYADTFGHVIALSSALILDGASAATDEPNPMGITRSYFQRLFGDLSKLDVSDANPEHLARQAVEKGLEKTDLYIACGWNDMLSAPNRALVKALEAMGYPCFYEEGPGSHEWAFWTKYLRRGLDRIDGLSVPSGFANPFFVKSEKDEVK